MLPPYSVRKWNIYFRRGSHEMCTVFWQGAWMTEKWRIFAKMALRKMGGGPMAGCPISGSGVESLSYEIKITATRMILLPRHGSGRVGGFIVDGEEHKPTLTDQTHLYGVQLIVCFNLLHDSSDRKDESHRRFAADCLNRSCDLYHQPGLMYRWRVHQKQKPTEK